MQKRQPVNRIVVPVTETESAIPTPQLPALFQGWIRDGKGRGSSPRTLEERELLFGKLLWFLQDRNFAFCGEAAVEEFLAYLDDGHTDPRGRWGNPKCRKPIRPATRLAYFRVLRAFFRFLERRRRIVGSPMATMDPPPFKQDQIVPFSEEQVTALLAAAHTSLTPRRDLAILLFLLDTGVRVSELAGMTVGSVDLDGFNARVLGKGNVARTVSFGRKVGKALDELLAEEEKEPEEPLFVAQRGTQPGEALTRNGILQVVGRLGRVAGVSGVRCSPHTFRHTFAINFLRNGGDVFTLREMLGHTSLAITQRYLLLAQADVATKHRAHSPADRMGKRVGKRK